MKLEDIGPEPDPPTDADYRELGLLTEYEDAKYESLKTMMRPSMVILVVAAYVLLFTDGKLSAVVGFGMIVLSFFLVLPFMWVGRRMKRLLELHAKIANYNVWREDKRLIEKRGES